MPSLIEPGPRTHVVWGAADLVAKDADQSFYRICGVTGSGKTHLTKLFVLNALKEVETNPQAKLILYEPKREFFAWLSSLGLRARLSYFLPSDRRSVALDFTADYPNDQDSRTLAHAFYPEDDRGPENQFWGDSLRTIYSQVFDAIKGKMGRADLRLMCLVLEDVELTRAVLAHDPYLKQAQYLVKKRGGSVSETADNIQMTIHSRIAEMKVMAAHLALAEREGGLFSLRRFVKKPDAGVLVVSKDATYDLVQDPMNGVVFWRLIQLLDSEQYDKRRKVFVVIDEFPTLAGDKPCPGIGGMFLRLRNRGVTVLMTYQAYTTLQRIYGKHASEYIGQCKNVIYLQQADVDSAKYAADDLGWERGYKPAPATWSYDGERGATHSVHEQYQDQPIFSHTDLMRILPARESHGVHGKAMSPGLVAEQKPHKRHYPPASARPWSFVYPPEEIAKIPATHPGIEEYEKRDLEIETDVGDYRKKLKLLRETQRVQPLSDEEREELCGALDLGEADHAGARQTPARPEDIIG